MIDEMIRGGATVRRAVLACAFVAISLASGCQLLEQDRRNADEDRQRQELATATRAAEVARTQELMRVQQEKQRLVTSPSLFLETSEPGYFDKGIINDYRQLIAVSVLNKSKYPVKNIRGDVDWVNDDGASVGSMPFSLKGSIPAGDTKRFTESAGTLANGTIQSSAKRARINITHIEIIEAP